MRLTFLGAAKTVTGSCFWLEADNHNILIDCGMFQGHNKENQMNFEPFPFSPSDIDYILVTHAHIDHTGRIPKICKDGFKNKIICTKATYDLCTVMLPDSGFIQEQETEWKNRKLKREGKKKLEPLYTHQDAVDCLEYFSPINYYEEISLTEHIKIKFLDAGHLLGSAMIEMWVTENDKQTKIVFTGDIGNESLPLVNEPDVIEEADYLIMESTYGGRFHKEDEVGRIVKFLDNIRPVIEKGGNVVIPSFAVGRTQELIYDLKKYKDKHPNQVEFLEKVPVYVDSPLAISATEIFRKNAECFNEEARKYVLEGNHPLEFEGLKFTKTPEESMLLNETPGAKLILSASGMCEAGRIKHHLKYNLWRDDSVIVFVGYQAEGTLGRMIVDGVEKVKIYGQVVTVKSKIVSIQGYSGHADQNGLDKWVSHLKKKPRKIFLVHGETECQHALSEVLTNEMGHTVVIPEHGDRYEFDLFDAVQTTSYTDLRNKFVRLQLLAQIEILQDEADMLFSQIDQISLNDKSDEEIMALYQKLLEVEKELRKIKFNTIK